MSVPEEEELLDILKRSLEEGEVDSAAVSTRGKEIVSVFKEYRRGTSRVNVLLGDVFSLEKKLEVICTTRPSS